MWLETFRNTFAWALATTWPRVIDLLVFAGRRQLAPRFRPLAVRLNKRARDVAETLLGEQVLLQPVWVEDESSAPAHALWWQHKLMERESYSAHPVWFPKEGGLLGIRRGHGERVGVRGNCPAPTTKRLTDEPCGRKRTRRCRATLPH